MADSITAHSITFKTDGVWKAEEFSDFVAAVDTIYRGLLAVHVTRQTTTPVEALMNRYSDRWHAYFRRYRSSPREPFPEDFPFLPFPPSIGELATLSSQRSDYLAFVYENILTIAPGDQLTINSVRMGSPGDISFLGLGPAIQAVNDAIKDLSWRNRHERERSEMEMQQSRERHKLDMLKGYLDLHGEYGEILAGPAKGLAADVLEGIAEVEQLEIEGKVQDVETDAEGTEET